MRRLKLAILITLIFLIERGRSVKFRMLIKKKNKNSKKVEKKEIELTPKQLEAYDHKRTQKKIEKYQEKWKYRKQDKKTAEKMKKAAVLTYDKLPDSIKKRTHGTLKNPKFIHKKYMSPISRILKKIHTVKKLQKTGSSLDNILELSDPDDNPFKDMVELQEILEDPEKAENDGIAYLAQKKVRARQLAQIYVKRMKGGK